VIVLDDLSGGYRENVPDGVTFEYGDCACQRTVDTLFTQYRFTHIWHLAAYAAEGLSQFIRGYNYRNNILGSVTLINAALNNHVEHFVFTSSMAVYGDQRAPFTEDMPFKPVDPYGIAKAAVEQDLAVAASMHGLNYTIFRPHNVYGERQNLADAYRNVVGIFINQALAGRPLTVFGDGFQLRAFSYIDDLVDPLIDAPWVVDANRKVFNIGGAKPFTINQLAGEILELAGGGTVENLPRRHEVDVAYSKHEELERVFGRQYQTPFVDGLERMWVWAKERGPQEQPPFTGIEVRRGLPSKWA